MSLFLKIVILRSVLLFLKKFVGKTPDKGKECKCSHHIDITPIGCWKFVGETPTKAKKAKIATVVIKRYTAGWLREKFVGETPT
jgi:hypothetical protein